MFKKSIQSFVSSVAGEVVITWLLPTVLPVVIAVIGVAQNIPWFYVLVGASLAFAGVSSGLLRFSEWTYRNRVEDKLVFQGIQVISKLDEHQNTVGVNFRINLTNAALFPIGFKVEEFYSKCCGKYPSKTKPLKETILLQPGCTGFFADGHINTGRLSVGAHKGEFACKINYGRKDNLKFELNLKQSVEISVDNIGQIYTYEGYDFTAND